MDGERILPLLLLVGRPASGKSEIIDYLQPLEAAERRSRFALGALTILDDFPMLWAWLEEDAILEQMGKSRLHTTADGYFVAPHLWDLLIRRLCVEYDKRAAEGTSVIMEFSRGVEHGGYRRAFGELTESVLARVSVMYVRVSFAESMRKNRRRFNPDRPHSILEHSLPDEKLKRLYERDDWQDLYRPDPDHILVQGHRVPAVVFENEDDVTTPRGPELGERLAACLQQLSSQARG